MSGLCAGLVDGAAVTKLQEELRVRECSIAELQAHLAGLQQQLTDRDAAAEELQSQPAAAAPAPAHVKGADWQGAAAAQPLTSEGAEGIAGHSAAAPDKQGQGTQQRVAQLKARLAEQAEQLAARDQLLEEQAADIKSAIEQLTGLQEVSGLLGNVSSLKCLTGLGWPATCGPLPPWVSRQISKCTLPQQAGSACALCTKLTYLCLL